MTEAWNQWQGQVINGEFRLQKYLGGSEQSAVFLTELPGQNPQPAAIKLIPAGTSNPSNVELQLSRWRLAMGLSHPHLIRLLHMGRCQLGSIDLLFVVMECAEENLAQILPERPLTSAETSDTLKPTLEALAYLHGKGLVHGHLKPANIMAIGDQLKLSSDGLSRAGESSLDSEKRSVYDPPEKASSVISPASDIWSLGMTLSEVLTQRLPSWNQKEQTDPVLPENLPAPFSDIVRGCLRRDPQSRWKIADITARLFLSSAQPAAALPQKRATVSPQTGPAKRRLVLPAVVAVFVLTAIFIGLKLFRHQPEGQQENSSVRAEQNQGPEEPHPASASDLKPSPVKSSPASSRSETRAVTTNRGSAEKDVVQQVLPDVPQKARDTIHGTIRVRVRVHVDPSGDVAGAELESAGPSSYFARQAVQAAQGWKFTPSTRDVGRDFILSFDFKNTETTASATQSTP